MSKIKIYNTKFELGIRSLMIINKYSDGIDIESLIILDYLSLHAKVIDTNLKSLHPDNPFYGIELLTKRDLIKESLNLLISKGLIDIKYSVDGIFYIPNGVSNYFLSYFEGIYFNDLNNSINEILNKFKGYSREDLKKYVNDNIELWSGEIIDS